MANVARQTSPSKGIEPQNHVSATQQPPQNLYENVPLLLLSCSNSYPTDIQESKNDKLTTLNGETTIPLLTITTPLIRERLVRDQQTSELYLPLTSTIVPERQQKILYVPLDFKKNLKMVALVD